VTLTGENPSWVRNRFRLSDWQPVRNSVGLLSQHLDRSQADNPPLWLSR